MKFSRQKPGSFYRYDSILFFFDGSDNPLHGFFTKLYSQLANQYVEFGSITPSEPAQQIHGVVTNNNIDIYDYKNIAVVGIQYNPNGYYVDVPGDWMGVLPVSMFKFYVEHCGDRDGKYFPNSAYHRLYFPGHTYAECVLLGVAGTMASTNHSLNELSIKGGTETLKFRKMVVLLFN